jgi:hypothetical protein
VTQFHGDGRENVGEPRVIQIVRELGKLAAARIYDDVDPPLGPR